MYAFRSTSSDSEVDWEGRTACWDGEADRRIVVWNMGITIAAEEGTTTMALTAEEEGTDSPVVTIN